MPNNVISTHLKPFLINSSRRLDAIIRHLSRLLSTSSGIEATLATVLFALSLLHAQLTRLLARQKERIALALAFQASNSSRPEESIVATISTPQAPTFLSQTCGGVKNMANACDEFLMFLRLSSLFHIYTWAHTRYHRPPRDPIIKLLLWAQILSATLFQSLENVAYLARKGVILRGKGSASRQRIPRLIASANRFWMTQHVLELLRLWRVKQLRWNEDFGAETVEETAKEKDGQVVEAESEELKKQWERDLVFNASWLPIRLHASHEDERESPVTETLFGMFGLLPSLIMMQDAWRASA